MTYDEQHGPVERGTAGHRASAEVADVAAEVAALDRIHAAPPTIDPTWLRSELAFGTTPREAMAQGAINRARNLEVARRHAAAARDAIRNARLYAGFDVGQGGGTAMTTYRVDGDTLRIVQAVTLPVRAQTVNVTLTIGGE
jgi:hypothetical protein